ncbi:MAG TPA: matrixin family metalloprotease [Candidatus Binatia bacterium]|nr:matrixin family metalloprotease [Candidatus Binatia bacterium]
MTAAGRRAVAPAVAALVLATAAHASAYAFLLVPGSGGVERRWADDGPDGPVVAWRLSSARASNVTGDRAPVDVLSDAFAAWQDLPDAAIRFEFAGAARDRNRRPADRVNVLTLDSQESLGPGVLAATFLTSAAGGALTDADIVFNTGVPFTTSAEPEIDRYDLQAIATHEIGHLIGLEHSGLVRATMVPYSERGESHGRTLSSDDAIAAALLYPEGDFLARTGAIEGRVTVGGAPVFLAHVVAATVSGLVVAGGFTAPDGRYRIAGLPEDVYVVAAEPLDGPVRPPNVQGFAAGFGGDATIGYGASFH